MTATGFLRAQLGQVVAGGCDYCPAEQELSEMSPGLFRLEVRHDDACEFLAQINKENQ
jgi:hypothetical protein